MSLREILLHLADASNTALALVVGQSDFSMAKCGKYHFYIGYFSECLSFLM